MYGDSYEDVQHIKMADGRFVMDHPAIIKGHSNIGREMGEGGLGDSLTDSQKETLEDKANSYREKSKEEQAKGNTRKANEWAAKERDIYDQLDKQQKKE